VGKSSFLRAGVLPYLEDECIGYRLMRVRAGRLDDERSRVLFVRSTEDPVGQLSEALQAFCRDPYEYATPNGGRVEIDLPGRLAHAAGATGGSEGPAIAQLRQSLASDPDALTEVLAAVAADLPFTLVVVIDQAEEMFTLAADERQVAQREMFLESIRRVACSSLPVKLIISLRTEFCGRLIDRLRSGVAAATGTREYLLTDLDRDGLVEAICRPTLAHPIRYSDEVPAQVYGFRYAAGVPEAIVGELIREGRRDGVLPLVQFLCDQLSRRAAGRGDSTVTLDDFEAIGRLRGGLRRHVEQQLERLAPGRASEQEAFKRLLARLTHRQSDGTLTTELLREDLLAADWRGSTPFSEIVRRADGLRLLRLSTRRLDDGREERFISLGHDALARVADIWREESARRARIRKVMAVAGTASLVAACMAILAIVAWREKLQADDNYQEAVLATQAADKNLHKALVAAEAARASALRLRLQAEIRDSVEKFDGDEGQLQQIDTLIAELGRLAPGEAAPQKHLLNARLARAIDAEFDRSAFRFKAPDLARVEGRIARLLEDAPNQGDELRLDVLWIRWRLIDAYRRVGRDAEALQLLEALLSERLRYDDRIGLTKDYCWMKILAGRPKDALPMIDRFVEKGSEEYDPALLPLLIDRARLHVALGRFDRAEDDVDRALREVNTDRFIYPQYAEACLLRGALWNHRGRPEKALEAWRRGNYRNWPYRWKDDFATVQKRDGRAVSVQNFVFFYTIIMGAAARDVTADEVGFAFQLRLGFGDARSMFGELLPAANLEFLTTPSLVRALNDCFQTRRGQDFLRRLAFYQVGYIDRVLEPLLHGVMSILRQSAMIEGIPDDVEPILWDALRECLEQFRTRRMGPIQFGEFVETYGGRTGWLGWKPLSLSLDPALIPPIAFVMGHRYLALKSPQEARMFFRVVLEKAPADSPLRRRALESIERIDRGRADRGPA
jgi:tetratricopeptide (TPR) repeat protein